MKNILHNAIIEVLKTLDLPTGIPFTIEHSDLSHGDYATNVALVYAQDAGQSPRELVGRIMEELVKQEIPGIASYEIAGPGFLNVTLLPSFFANAISKAAMQNTYGKCSLHEARQILIEHSSPNLFKPFHIGHFMNNAIGEAVKRLMVFAGAQVTTIAFPSDVSLGIGKAVFVLLKKGINILESDISIQEKVAFLGECYVEGTRWYDEHPEDQTRIREITQELYDKADTEGYYAYLKAREINLEYFKLVTARLGSEFNGYIFESEAGAEGKALVESHIGTVFEQSDGAIIYNGEERGLHTRVFLNAEGNPVYEAKDLGLLKLKFDRYDPDLSLFITDHEQGEYFKVVLDAASRIHPEWKEKSIHLKHGRLQFKGQKLSSRLGNVQLAEDLVNTVLEDVRERSPEESPETQDAIAIGALKFAILRSEAGRNINFDPETSLSFEGDSGPYLQYTHARLSSLLAKADYENLVSDKELHIHDVHDVHRFLYRFPEVVENAVLHYAPHEITTYLLDLAHAFNSYYGSTKIIDTEDSLGTESRLVLIQALKTIFKNGLWLLGIQAPERM